MDGDTVGMAALVAMTALLWAPTIIESLRTGRKRKLPKGAEPDPICGCEHHLAFHTAEGACKGQTQHYLGQNDHGFNRYEIVDCACQQYVGPVPAITPQIMRELTMPPSAPEPYSQDK